MKFLWALYGGILVWWIPQTGNTSEQRIDRAIVIIEMSKCCGEKAFPAAENALAAELSLLNTPIIRIPGQSADIGSSRIEQKNLARRYDAAASVRIYSKGNVEPVEVALWIEEGRTKKSTYRLIEIERTPEISLAELVAIRTVETLRSSLQEQGPPIELPSKSEMPEVRRKSPTGMPPWYLLGYELGSGLSLSTGDGGQRGVVAAAFSIQPVRRLDVSVCINGSPFGQSITTPQMRGELFYLMLQGWLSWHFSPTRSIHPALGLGGGVFLAELSRESRVASPNSVSKYRSPYIGLSSRIYFGGVRRLQLFLGANIGLLLPPVQIVDDNVTVAIIGRPLFELMAGIKLRFGKLTPKPH